MRTYRPVKDPARGYCKAQVVWGAFGQHRQCQKKEKRDGWCTAHHPDTCKRRAEEQERKYAEERQRRGRHWYTARLGELFMKWLDQQRIARKPKDFGPADADRAFAKFVKAMNEGIMRK